MRTVKKEPRMGLMRTRLLSNRPFVALLVLSAGAGGPLSASGCGGDDSGNEPAAPSRAPRGEITAKHYDRSLFDDSSATITNKWFPATPGTEFTWSGFSEDAGERERHRIVSIVTDVTKEIDGVRSMVAWDRDWSGGSLVESELLVLAQDRGGNVWHMGEYTETYEEGEFIGGQAWFAGHLKGARAGIHMRADPRLGTPAYSQGFAPAPYHWDDWGKVFETDRRTCVPVGCFEDVLVIDEFEPAKPGEHQLKYYAPGKGLVRVGWRGSDESKEILVLRKVRHLGGEAMGKVRQRVTEHEARANVYGSTPRAQPRGANVE
jgi:hypothetical protein